MGALKAAPGAPGGRGGGESLYSPPWETMILAAKTQRSESLYFQAEKLNATMSSVCFVDTVAIFNLCHKSHLIPFSYYFFYLFKPPACAITAAGLLTHSHMITLGSRRIKKTQIKTKTKN